MRSLPTFLFARVHSWNDYVYEQSSKMSTQQLQSRDNLIFTTINVAILGPSIVLLFDLIICNWTRFLLVSNIRNRLPLLSRPSLAIVASLPPISTLFIFYFQRRTGEKIYFFNSCPVDQRTFHFCTIQREERIQSVEWISENRVVVSSRICEIQIWEIDESTGTVQEVQKLEPHGV